MVTWISAQRTDVRRSVFSFHFGSFLKPFRECDIFMSTRGET